VADAVHRFAFKRRLQLIHTDGLSFDYLHAMAKELQDSQSVMLLGTGDKGTGPLVFQTNGRPYRGFLYGKVMEGQLAGSSGQDSGYQLILLLSDMELKAPVGRTSLEKRN